MGHLDGCVALTAHDLTGQVLQPNGGWVMA